MFRFSNYLFYLTVFSLCARQDALEILSVNSQKEHICGAYQINSRFKNQPNDKGFIVQKFTRHEKITDCKGQKTHLNPITYFEAWPELIQNKKYQNFSDIWQGPENLETRGEIVIEAEVGLFQVSELPGEMVQFNPITNAGALYSGVKKPSFWPAKNKIKRSALITWDCCVSPTGQSHVYTHGFYP